MQIEYHVGLISIDGHYLDSAHNIFSVSVGFSQPLTKNPYVYVAGEVAPQDGIDTDNEGNKGMFIGLLISANPPTVESYIENGESFSCDEFQTRGLKFLSSHGHQEYFVIAVEPFGRFAIGLATNFTFYKT